MRKIKDVLKIVFLTLAILTMLVSLFGRGHAESASDAFSDFFSNNNVSESNQQIILNAYSECPYFMIFYSEDKTYSVLMLSPHPKFTFCSFSNVQNNSLRYYNTSNQFRYMLTTLENYGTDYKGYVFWCKNSSLCGVKLLPSDSSRTCSFDSQTNRYYYYGSWFTQTYVIGDSSNKSSFLTFPLSYVSSFGENGAFLNGSSGLEWNYYAIQDNIVPVVVNPDISVYKSLDNNGLPVLNVSWSKTPLPGTGGYNYAGYTNVDIKFDIVGSERVVSINSDDYPELFSNYVDGKFYIPWSVFQKVALLVPDYDTVTSVSVTQVDVSMKGYPQGATVESAQTYTMNTLVSPALVFKGQDSSIPSFDNDDVQKGSEITPSEVYTPTEINYYIQKFSSSYGSGQWLYTTSDLQVPDNMDVFYLTLYGRESWFSGNYVDDTLLELNSFNIEYNENYDIDGMIRYVLDHVSDFVNGNFSIYELAANNLFSSDYDIIAVQLYSFDSSLNKTKMGNLYFYTSRYYLSLINRQTVGLSEMMNITNSYLFGTYDFLYTRLNNMNGNMVSFFESSLNKQNSVLSYLGSVNSGLNNLNSNFVNLTSSTHGYLNNILTAIDNIDVPGPADLSGVLSKMDVIGDNIADLPNAVRSDLIYLFLPSYDDIDVNYTQYKESIGILALPFDTCKLVLDTVDDNYSQNLSIDLPKIEFLQYKLYDGMHYELNPWVFFDDTKLSEQDNPTGQGFVMGLRYFIAFSAIYGAVLSTYLHIFRRVESN